VSITNAERTQLRSVIRQQFKVLRSEVELRRVELAADLERALTIRFTDHDKRWGDAIFLVQEAGREANRKANDIIRGLMDDWKEQEVIATRSINTPTQERTQLRRDGIAHIDADVRAALVTLDRQEADLLRRLAEGALESDEARAFLGTIPTVASLVPGTRMLELEQALGGHDQAP
jgi:predicted nucleic acid-binding Zn ribbon protein